MALIDLIEYPTLCYEASSKDAIVQAGLRDGVLPLGQYAIAIEQSGTVLLARDPVGCNKLFYGTDVGGNIVVGNRIARLSRHGVALAALSSCPPGHLLEVSPAGAGRLAGQSICDLKADDGVVPDVLRMTVRAILDAAFAWLASTFQGSRFVVCLSGGLDSSVVASFAAAHLPGVHAATFTYLDTDDLRRYALGAPVNDLASASDDYRAAAAVAEALGLTVLPVVRSREAVAGAVHAAVGLGQDWRDFNVHCATVNLFLAQEIRAAFPGDRVIVLTGDLMNEFVCDYHEERVADTVYYKLPRVSVGRRRKYLVRGLDAGDREIGVFAAYGLTTCQPFALLAEAYMRLPAELLEVPDAKWHLNSPLVARSALPKVSRSKARAQVGGADLGTLGLYHRLGVDEAALRRAWHDQFPGEPAAACEDLIQFGRYRGPRDITDR